MNCWHCERPAHGAGLRLARGIGVGDVVRIGRRAVARQLARLASARQRAAEHEPERPPVQELAGADRLLLALGQQRDVGSSRVAPVRGPLGRTVADDEQLVAAGLGVSLVQVSLRRRAPDGVRFVGLPAKG